MKRGAEIELFRIETEIDKRRERIRDEEEYLELLRSDLRALEQKRDRLRAGGQQ